jgi:hypothetical protein
MNPHLAVPGAAKLLSDLQGRLGGMAPALAAYNGSVHPTDPTQWKPETQQYVQNIMPGQLPVVDAKAFGLDGMLADALKYYYSGSADMLGQTQSSLRDAQAQQQDLMGQMQQNVDQPAPENNPQAEFMTRLMGNISQVLAPQLQGQQQAEQTIQKPLDDIQRQRGQHFQLLAQKHQEAARRAEKLGDQETALKHYNAVEKHLKQVERLSGLIKNRDDNASREKIAADKRAGGSGGSKADPALAQVTGPMRDRMKSLAKSIDSGKLKGDALMKARREYTNLSKSNRATLANYKPGGPLEATQVDVIDEIGADVLKQATAKGWSKDQVIRYISRLPGGETNWEHGQEGITKHEFKMWIEDNMQDGPQQGGGAAPTQGGAQLVSRSGAQATPEVQHIAQLAQQTRQQLATVMQQTRAAGGNEALTMAPRLREKLHKLDAKLSSLGFTLQYEAGQ